MGKGSGEPSAPNITTVQPTLPAIPNQANLNSLAQARTYAATPYMASPWRAMDYLAQYQMPAQVMPQFQPSQGLGPQVQGSTPPPVPQTPPMQLGTNWWNQAQMPMPSPQGQQAMQQNVSPSLAGLFALLQGQTPQFLGGGQQQQPGQVPDTNGVMQRPPMQGIPGAGSVDPNVNLTNLPKKEGQQ